MLAALLLPTSDAAMSDRSVNVDLLEIWRTARVWVDLPLQGGVEVLPSERTDAALFPNGIGAVHLLSAWNPGGVELDRATNESRHLELLLACKSERVEHWDAAGYSVDRSWFERGLALPLAGRGTAVALAAQFGQLAIYEWTAGDLSIIECGSGVVTASYGWTARPLLDAAAT